MNELKLTSFPSFFLLLSFSSSFRDGLIPGTNYMSIGLGAGLANQVSSLLSSASLLRASRSCLSSPCSSSPQPSFFAQIIATMNLLLVSRLSNRIPVLPDFTRDWGHMPLGAHEHTQTNVGLPVVSRRAQESLLRPSRLSSN